MGRPIKKKWFTAKIGSIAGNLQLASNTGASAIESQSGTRKYHLDNDQVVRLIEGTPTAIDEANLTHNGKLVSKITQYRMYYFEGGSGVWRDRDGNAIGAFTPALVAEDPSEPGEGEPGTPPAPTTATGTATVTGDIVTGVSITDGGSGYQSAPAVTIVGDGSGATATASITNGVVTGVVVTDGGSGYTGAGTTVTFGAPARTAPSAKQPVEKSVAKKKEKKKEQKYDSNDDFQ